MLLVALTADHSREHRHSLSLKQLISLLLLLLLQCRLAAYMKIFELEDTNEALAIVDSRLRPLCATHDVYLLIFIAERNLVGIDAVVKRDVIHKTGSK